MTFNSWELATDPLHSDLGGGEGARVGPGMAFAKALVAEDDSITVGLVPLAQGATTITEWSRGSALYQATINAARVAQRRGVISGILWHQGEHDGIFRFDAVAYDERLKQLQDDLRKDLGIVELPFISGGLVPSIGDNDVHRYGPQVDMRLSANPDISYLTAYVPTYDLNDIGDNLHFDVPSQRILGRRYAEEYLYLSGFYTEQGIERILSEAEMFTLPDALEGEVEDVTSTWLYHPETGLIFFDENNFPLVKHAQLGWVDISFTSSETIRVQSEYFEPIVSWPNPPDNGLYVVRPNEDPDDNSPETVYYINFLANEIEDRVVFNHSTNTWSLSLDNAPVLETV